MMNVGIAELCVAFIVLCTQKKNANQVVKSYGP